jgi:CBS domain-containing protein
VYLRPRARVREIMVEPLRLPPETPLRDAIELLRVHPSRMVVVEKDGRPLGVATLADLAEPLTGVRER